MMLGEAIRWKEDLRPLYIILSLLITNGVFLGTSMGSTCSEAYLLGIHDAKFITTLKILIIALAS